MRRMARENITQLKETTIQKPKELYAVVEKCVLCKERHIHAAEEGYRVGHCVIFRSPPSYKLLIDRGNPENIRLAEKYGIRLDLDYEYEERSGDN